MSIFEDIGIDLQEVLEKAQEQNPELDLQEEEFRIIQQYSDGQVLIVTVTDDDEGKRAVNIEITDEIVIVLPEKEKHEAKIFKEEERSHDNKE